MARKARWHMSTWGKQFSRLGSLKFLLFESVSMFQSRSICFPVSKLCNSFFDISAIQKKTYIELLTIYIKDDCRQFFFQMKTVCLKIDHFGNNFKWIIRPLPNRLKRNPAVSVKNLISKIKSEVSETAAIRKTLGSN